MIQRTGLGWIAAGVLAAGGCVALLVLRPVLWSGGASAPERFDQVGREVAFLEVSRAAGLTHTHHKVQLDPRLEPIMPWMASVGAAAAAADYDGDGDVDLYLVNGHFPSFQASILYRNETP